MMTENLEQLEYELTASLRSLLRVEYPEVFPRVYYSDILSCICMDISIASVNTKAVNFVTKYCMDRNIFVKVFSQTVIMIQIEDAHKLLDVLKLEGY